MIVLYSGTPGSGKSLHAAKDIYGWLRSGRPCICNFDINLTNIPGGRRLGEFYYIDNEILTPDILIKYSQIYFKSHKFKEGAIRLYIDEAQLLFNSRDWQSKSRRAWLRFFTQHRKLGYDIYLMSQYDKMLDKQIRCLIEYEYKHRKVSNAGFWGQVFNLLAFGGLFCYVCVWYGMHDVVSGKYFKASNKYYSLYDTLNLFGGV